MVLDVRDLSGLGGMMLVMVVARTMVVYSI